MLQNYDTPLAFDGPADSRIRGSNLGKFDENGEAGRGCGLGSDRSTVLDHDLLDDGQPQSGTPR